MHQRPEPVANVPASTMTVLAPHPDACQTCAREHPPSSPHDPASLYWATVRSMRGEPSPTWDDALAHCPDDVFALWRELLAERGIVVRERQHA